MKKCKNITARSLRSFEDFGIINLSFQDPKKKKKKR